MKLFAPLDYYSEPDYDSFKRLLQSFGKPEELLLAARKELLDEDVEMTPVAEGIRSAVPQIAQHNATEAPAGSDDCLTEHRDTDLTEAVPDEELVHTPASE